MLDDKLKGFAIRKERYEVSYCDGTTTPIKGWVVMDISNGELPCIMNIKRDLEAALDYVNERSE